MLVKLALNVLLTLTRGPDIALVCLRELSHQNDKWQEASGKRQMA